MAGMFESLKRVFTGEVLAKIDTPIHNGMTTMSLRLKKKRNSEVKYVVLAGLSGGNYQYFHFEMDEFDRFIAAANNIRATAYSGGTRPGQR
jgi:hypothetical protein